MSTCVKMIDMYCLARMAVLLESWMLTLDEKIRRLALELTETNGAIQLSLHR